jgi:anti-sigma factor RsiW
MSCRDTIHLICLYLEGKLSPGVASEIQKHLEHCADCHLVMDAAINTLDRYFSQQPPVEAPAATRAA